MLEDKQIIIYKKECYNEPHCSLNQVLEQLKAKEQECEELKKIIDEAKNSKLDLKSFLVGEAIQNEYEQQLDQLKEQIKYQNNFIESLLKATNNSEWLDKSILDDEAGEIIEKIELDYIQLDQLKAENEILEKVNKANQEKIKKLNEKLEEEFIAKQYGDEALFFTLMNIKEICNNNDEFKADNLAKKILEEIKVVIDE